MGTESTTNWRDVSTSDHFVVPRAEPPGTSRRSFLRTAGIGGLGAAGLIGAASQPVSALAVGRNKSFTTLNKGNSGVRYLTGTGDRATTGGTRHYPNLNYMKAEVEEWPFLANSAEKTLAWAWIGQQFGLTGRGSRSATVRTIGTHGGDLYFDSGQTGRAQVDLRMFVHDLTAKNKQYSRIYRRTLTRPGRVFIDEKPYTETMSVDLTGGHKYRVGVEVKALGEMQPSGKNGFIGAWWHPQGRYDSGDDGGVYLDRIRIAY